MGKALIIKGADFSQVAVDTIDIAVGQPTISIDLFGNVTITSPNGEDIYYTTDGSNPTSQSTKYTAGFAVQMNTTVKAVCYFGGNYSEVASQLYDGTLQAPNIDITDKGVVTITATDNASIRYTVDGQTDPTASTGTEYSAPFTVEDGVEVRAIAYVTQGGTTISSSVSSKTAEVPEGITFGKKFLVNNNVPTGALTDDPTRFVSPKIPITGGTQFSWAYKNCTYQVDFVVEYDSSNEKNEYWNVVNNADAGSFTITKTTKTGTTYVRFSGLIGSAQAGMKITVGGTTLWEYDGSTE